ncbi:MAG: alpha/beta fold hydrolase [Ignavibacteria bacterium]
MKSGNNLVVHISGNGQGIPVIFIHGFPLDHKMWDNQVEFLKEEYRCITYDIRGLGESPAGDGQYTIELFVDDLLEIMAEYTIEKPVLCGFSMGGYIAQRAVQREPDAFGGLILCNTRSESDNNEGKIKRAASVKLINMEGLETYVTDFISNCLSDISLKEKKGIFDKVISNSIKFDSLGVKGCLIAMAGRTDTTSFLEKITIPVLVIAGLLDKIASPLYMRTITEKLRLSEFAVAPNAGHLAPLENPGFVNDVIAGFLRRRITH